MRRLTELNASLLARLQELSNDHGDEMCPSCDQAASWGSHDPPPSVSQAVRDILDEALRSPHFSMVAGAAIRSSASKDKEFFFARICKAVLSRIATSAVDELPKFVKSEALLRRIAAIGEVVAHEEAETAAAVEERRLEYERLRAERVDEIERHFQASIAALVQRKEEALRQLAMDVEAAEASVQRALIRNASAQTQTEAAAGWDDGESEDASSAEGEAEREDARLAMEADFGRRLEDWKRRERAMFEANAVAEMRLFKEQLAREREEWIAALREEEIAACEVAAADEEARVFASGCVTKSRSDGRDGGAIAVEGGGFGNAAGDGVFGAGEESSEGGEGELLEFEADLVDIFEERRQRIEDKLRKEFEEDVLALKIQIGAEKERFVATLKAQADAAAEEEMAALRQRAEDERAAAARGFEIQKSRLEAELAAEVGRLREEASAAIASARLKFEKDSEVAAQVLEEEATRNEAKRRILTEIAAKEAAELRLPLQPLSACLANLG